VDGGAARRIAGTFGDDEVEWATFFLKNGVTFVKDSGSRKDGPEGLLIGFGRQSHLVCLKGAASDEDRVRHLSDLVEFLEVLEGGKAGRGFFARRYFTIGCESEVKNDPERHRNEAIAKAALRKLEKCGQRARVCQMSDSAPQITAYVKTFCGWSEGVRAIMRKYDLSFEEKDIIKNPAFRWEMEQKTGQPLSPCVEVNGEMLPDVSGEEVEAYLIEKGLVEASVEAADAPIDASCSPEQHAAQAALEAGEKGTAGKIVFLD